MLFKGISPLQCAAWSYYVLHMQPPANNWNGSVEQTSCQWAGPVIGTTAIDCCDDCSPQTIQNTRLVLEALVKSLVWFLNYCSLRSTYIVIAYIAIIMCVWELFEGRFQLWQSWADTICGLALFNMYMYIVGTTRGNTIVFLLLLFVIVISSPRSILLILMRKVPWRDDISVLCNHNLATILATVTSNGSKMAVVIIVLPICALQS